MRLFACSWSMLCRLWRMTSRPNVLFLPSTSPSPRKHCHVISGSTVSSEFFKHYSIEKNSTNFFLCFSFFQIKLLLFVCAFSRDVLKWLFSAIMKSTEHDESTEVARGRDEQIRLITKKTKLSFFLVWPFLHLFHIQLLMFTFLSPPEWCPSSRGCCPLL